MKNETQIGRIRSNDTFEMWIWTMTAMQRTSEITIILSINWNDLALLSQMWSNSEFDWLQ